jgi:hypothetical protein
MIDQLINYVVNWKNDNSKPCNEVQFIDLFLEFINTNELYFTFDGDGAYFGKQITLCRDAGYRGHDVLTFEVAYSATQLTIYDGNHNGYWTPAYVNILSTDARFNEIKNSIFTLIKTHIGLE